MDREFKIGDSVAYTVLGQVSEHYYGVVEDLIQSPYYWSSVGAKYATVTFYATADNPEYPEHHCFGTSNYPLESLTKKEPYRTYTTEERVLRKTKKLWNESNYVKKHPQFAY